MNFVKIYKGANSAPYSRFSFRISFRYALEREDGHPPLIHPIPEEEFEEERPPGVDKAFSPLSNVSHTVTDTACTITGAHNEYPDR